jgi:hypothetical protein
MMTKEAKTSAFELIDLSQDAQTNQVAVPRTRTSVSSIIELLSSSDIQEDATVATPVVTDDEETVDLSDHALVGSILSTKSTLMLSERQASFAVPLERSTVTESADDAQIHSGLVETKESDVTTTSLMKRGFTIATTTPSLALDTTTARRTPVKRLKRPGKSKKVRRESVSTQFPDRLVA